VRRVICGSLAALVCLVGVASAQEAGQLTQTYLFQPKSGMSGQFEQSVKSHLSWLKENGEPWSWSAYQSVMGDHIGVYAFVTHGHSWEEFDAAAEHRRAAAQHWREHVSPFIETRQAAILSVEPALSRLEGISEPVRYIQASTFYVRPLTARMFVQQFGVISQAVGSQESPPPVLAYRLVNGGEPRITFIHPLSAWNDVAKVERAVDQAVASLGAEAEEIAKGLSDLTVRSETSVLVSRPDLSYAVASAEDAVAEK